MTIRPLAALLVLTPALAFAQTTPAPAAPDAPPAATRGTELSMKSMKLKLSGVLFASWGIDAASASSDPDAGTVAGNNRFDVTRAYINIEPQITEKIALRITPDITRVKGTDGNVDGNLAFRLKYAYAQFNDIVPGLALKAGMQHTAYIDFEDSLWKYRVLGPSAYEYFTGKPSSDLGVGVVGKAVGGMLDYQVVLSNGEGYSKAERSPAYPNGDGKYKEMGARVTVAPFIRGQDAMRGLKLTGFGQYGFRESDLVGTEREHATTTRIMGLASYQHPTFTVAAGYGIAGEDVLGATEVEEISGSLITAFGHVNLPYDLRLLARFDSYDPNGDAKDDERTRIIGGVAYLFSDMVQVVGNWQHYGYTEAAAEELDGDVVGDAFFVHLEAKY